MKKSKINPLYAKKRDEKKFQHEVKRRRKRKILRYQEKMKKEQPENA